MKRRTIWLFALMLLVSVLLLIAGHRYVTRGGRSFVSEATETYVGAVVTRVLRTEDVYSETGEITESNTYFLARLTSGDQKGSTVEAVQNESSYTPFNPRPVAVGDKIILGNYGADSGLVWEDDVSWNFVEHKRSDAILVLAILFLLFLLLYGRGKGLKTILTLALTVGAVLFVFLPAVILGENLYVWAVLVCLYITVMTLCLVNGASPMTLTAVLGCSGGVLLSAVITLLTDSVIHLSGYTDSCSIYLLYIGEKGVDLRALIYGSILIGSVGAVMDVAVDIAASLKELTIKLKHPSFRTLLTSGFRIGRDVIGTMSNTLVLAYLGGSMCSLLLYVYNVGASPLYLFNLEPILVELLKILVGSCGILLTLPLTSLIGAYFYTRPSLCEALLREGGEDAPPVTDRYADELEAATAARETHEAEPNADRPEVHR